MIEQWITATQAQTYTGKSFATINRYIAKYKNDPNAIKSEGNKTLINSEFLGKIYPIISDNQSESHDKHIENQKEFAELTLQKQDKDIINKILESQKALLESKTTPILRLPSLWLTIGFIIIFIVMGYLGYLYRNEMISSFQNAIKDKDNNLSDLKVELNNTRAEYKDSLKKLDDLRESYNKKLEAKDKEISDLKEQIQEAEEGI